MRKRTLRRKVRNTSSIVSYWFSPRLGVFGERLELLVEREGVDSLLGASEAPLRVPSFIDDVISAMRTMGQYQIVFAQAYLA